MALGEVPDGPSADDGKHRDRGGDEPEGAGHPCEPPRDGKLPLLWGRLDREKDGIDRGGRGSVGTVLQPVVNGALEQLVAHARCPSRCVASARAASKAV